VSESGYYAQHDRPPSARAIRHALLIDVIRAVHLDSRGTYGARRVHAELTLGHDLVVGRCAVELLMHRACIAGLSGRPRFRRIPHVATAADLVQRRFRRDDPDRLWVTDITEHPTREGKVYCAVVLDVWSRRVVGWSIDASPTAALVTNALGMAIEGRRPDGTVIHSDQGTQFTSWAFTRRALDSGLMPSMGTVGSCFDNAMIESFWSCDAGRAPGPAELADPGRARQRDLRVPRDLSQPPAPSLAIGHAYPGRVRDSAPVSDSRVKSSYATPRNSGHPILAVGPRAADGKNVSRPLCCSGAPGGPRTRANNNRRVRTPKGQWPVFGPLLAGSLHSERHRADPVCGLG
jgi:transposase InsO family protein